MDGVHFELVGGSHFYVDARNADSLTVQNCTFLEPQIPATWYGTEGFSVFTNIHQLSVANCIFPRTARLMQSVDVFVEQCSLARGYYSPDSFASMALFANSGANLNVSHCHFVDYGMICLASVGGSVVDCELYELSWTGWGPNNWVDVLDCTINGGVISIPGGKVANNVVYNHLRPQQASIRISSQDSFMIESNIVHHAPNVGIVAFGPGVVRNNFICNDWTLIADT